VAEPSDTTIYVASINTAWNTELCLRSLDVRDSGHPYRVVVGDCGSTDRTLPMLVKMLKRGVVDDIELAPRGRTHAGWIDHWLSTCSSDYMVLLDSDVEIRKDNWLTDLHRARALHDAAFVTAAMEAERLEPTKPGVMMAGRPTVYCMLIDVGKVRGVGRSFEEWYDGPVGYDVAAWVFLGLVQAKIPYVVMPESWLPSVKHYEAMSYGKNLIQRRAQVRKNRSKVTVRVLFYRAGGRAGANILLMWRDFRGRLFRLRRHLHNFRSGMSRGRRQEIA
jgi:glycosyltransferase involved in cell wall biosynthesis